MSWLGASASMESFHHTASVCTESAMHLQEWECAKICAALDILIQSFGFLCKHISIFCVVMKREGASKATLLQQ